MTASDLKVEYDIDSGGGFLGYTDISGYGTKVEPEGGERAYSATHVFDSDTPVMGYGKRAEVKATLTAVFTQADSDPFDEIYDAKVNNYPFKLKWSPAGGAAGDKEWEIVGRVIECIPPGGEADSEDLILFEAVIVGDDVDEDTVAP